MTAHRIPGSPERCIEVAKAEIFRALNDLLHIDHLSSNPDFFEIGGDSLLATLLAAKMTQSGYHCAPIDVLQNPRVDHLAALLCVKIANRDEIASHAAQGYRELCPLVPYQSWLLDKDLANPNHWNLGPVLALQPGVNLDVLKASVRGLFQRHEALRLRFVNMDSVWYQYTADFDESRDYVDEFGASSLAVGIGTLDESIDLIDGPTARIALIWEPNADLPTLVFALHHAVADGVSSRYLIDDLEMAYRQLSSIGSLDMGREPDQFLTWAHELAEYAKSPNPIQDIGYWWNALQDDDVTPMPVDFPGGANIEGSVRVISVTLDAATTQLLSTLGASNNTANLLSHMSLAAMVDGYGDWANAKAAVVMPVHHGRIPLFDNVDSSRIIGPMLTHYPIVIGTHHDRQAEQSTRDIAKIAEAVPRAGITYGLLRYRPEGSASLVPDIAPQLGFNYLGHYSQGNLGGVTRRHLFTAPPRRAHDNIRNSPLYFRFRVVDQKLQIILSYSANLHTKATARNLIRAISERLMSSAQSLH